MLGRQELEILIEHEVVENRARLAHPVSQILLKTIVECLVRLHIASLNQKFLQFETAEAEVLVLLEEFVLVNCVLQHEELRAHRINRALLADLNAVHVLSHPAQLIYLLLDLCGRRVRVHLALCLFKVGEGL